MKNNEHVLGLFKFGKRAHIEQFVFRKFSDFVYQSGFRIAVVPRTNEPLSLKVGDISDISIIGNPS